VQSGEYPLKRPLVLVTGDIPKGPVKDFLDFLLSTEGQAIVGKKFVPAR
jgi:phosphate transport system substrate-binding protein